MLPEHITEPLERLNCTYFSDPGRTISISKGEMLVGQGEECHRLYLILEGALVAYREAEKFRDADLPTETVTRKHEVFRAGPGSYVCVQAFFSRVFHSSNDIVAVEDTRLAYIDDTTEPVDVEHYGSMEHQFIPVLMHELAARNIRMFSHATEKEEAQRLLQRAEMASTLAQLSAGIAHELNNAVGIEANVGFLGISFIMLGVFHLIFLAGFYKTAVNVGMPFVWSSVAFLLMIVIAEVSLRVIPYLRDTCDSMAAAMQVRQIPLLIGGFLVYLLLTWLAYRLSVKRFEALDL